MRIGLAAPSFDLSGVEEAAAERGLRFLRDAGADVVFGEHVRRNPGHGAAALRRRAEDLHRLFADDGVDLVLCAFGGHNAVSVLPYLDPGLAGRKPVVGFSDATAVVHAVAAAGGRGVLGPTFVSFCEPAQGQPLWAGLRAALAAAARSLAAPGHVWDDAWYCRPPGADPGEYARPHGGHRFVLPGRATGPAAGGTVDVLLALLDFGHPVEVAGRVVLLEAVDDGGPARFAESLARLAARVPLAEAAALVIGQFGRGWAGGGAQAEVVRQLVEQVLPGFAGPVVCEVNVSHTRPQHSIELGVPVTVDSARGVIEIGCRTREYE